VVGKTIVFIIMVSISIFMVKNLLVIMLMGNVRAKEVLNIKMERFIREILKMIMCMDLVR